jgi:outer membrane protein assembly factor BamE
MRMLPFHSRRFPSVTATASLVLLAAFVTGCATKNPLIDEPIATNKSPAAATPAPVPTAAPTQASAPIQTAETKPASTPAPSGVQTSKQRRFLGIFSPYRPNIQQGNFVSREMIAQLREGMTPDQVRFVLGTPLLNDIFHANRWDYPFRLQEGNGEVISSRVTVYFKDGRLARVEGGDLPTEEAFLSLIAGTAPAPKPAQPGSVQQTPPTAVDNPSINRQQ